MQLTILFLALHPIFTQTQRCFNTSRFLRHRLVSGGIEKQKPLNVELYLLISR